MKIDKAYFKLVEVEERWGMPESDLVYLAENGQLRLSVRVFGVPVEFGDIEVEPDGRWFSIPHTQERHSGLLDLRPVDAFEVFRSGEVVLSQFRPREADYACLHGEHDGVHVRRSDLLVRKEERDRFEAEVGFSGLDAPGPGPVFAPSADYREVRFQDLTFQFGAIQAEVVRVLHAAHCAGEPWVNGKDVLTAAGSRSLKMSDVFKSKRHWRRLIRSNTRGLYRLALD